MKRIALLTLFLSTCSISFAQLEKLRFGTDTTLEIVTWNIEHFPKNDDITLQWLANLVTAIDADVYCLQEIEDTAAFVQMMEQIPGYNYRIGIKNNPKEFLTFIFKSATIKLHRHFPIYVDKEFKQPFPRRPQVLDFSYGEHRITLINNHLKALECCGEGPDMTQDPTDNKWRRFWGCNLLKEYADQKLRDVPVVMVGDWNDCLNVEAQNNVFQSFIDDPEHFQFADWDIAHQAPDEWNWSYHNKHYNSHLDHILINDKLFSFFKVQGSDIQVIAADRDIPGGRTFYQSNVTDHRPVALKLNFNPVTTNIFDNLHECSLSAYPNPGNSEINFRFTSEVERVVIFNLMGQVVDIVNVDAGARLVRFDISQLQPGIYFAAVFDANTRLATTKFVVAR